VNECRAIVLAMIQIRKVNPAARLIQTEDLGEVAGNGGMLEEVNFLNERRWLTFDLLTGRVDPHHPFWKWLQVGVSQAELEFFLEHPSPPDICGLNYYITSDRTLDDRETLYPLKFRCEERAKRFADIESVRSEFGLAGQERVLLQAWSRYQLPLALTEVHLDATREEQLRWVHQAWQGALAARAQGADVRAVTLWALLGCFDWNTLLKGPNEYYESGVFDVRGPKPRPTALAQLARALATGTPFEHPVLAGDPWWSRAQRKTHGFLEHSKYFDERTEYRSHSARPLLITGGNGTLARACAHACEVRGLSHRLSSRAELDIADSDSVARAVDALNPWAIINAAGVSNARAAEAQAGACFRANTLGAQNLAVAAERRGIPLVIFSSDHVFDGGKGRPYVESDPRSPADTLGRSKAEAEDQVMRACSRALILRAGAFFGPWDEVNFISQMIVGLLQGDLIVVPSEEVVSPTYLPDLVRCTLDLLIDEAWGLWHLANAGEISASALARRLASRLHSSPELVSSPNASRRCRSLASERGSLMPSFDDAFERYFHDVNIRRLR
jgi:dTDP-4-dehydrorhamnose reductase